MRCTTAARRSLSCAVEDVYKASLVRFNAFPAHVAYRELPGGEEGGGESGVTGLAGVTGLLGAAGTTSVGGFWAVIDVGNGRPCG